MGKRKQRSAHGVSQPEGLDTHAGSPTAAARPTLLLVDDATPAPALRAIDAADPRELREAAISGASSATCAVCLAPPGAAAVIETPGLAPTALCAACAVEAALRALGMQAGLKREHARPCTCRDCLAHEYASDVRALVVRLVAGAELGR